jgi:2-octaprenyl-6-methoxyphenol hydroxylase
MTSVKTTRSPVRAGGVARAEPMQKADVVMIGGGLVGASLAIALSGSGLSMLMIEGVAPDASRQPSFDDRTTALGNGSRKIFETLGVWSAISPYAAPIRRIHVSDAGRFGFARLDCSEHDLDAFGYVVTNRQLGAALQGRLDSLPDLDLLRPAICTGIEQVDAGLIVHIDHGAPVLAKLVIGADGAGSVVRASAGLPAEVQDYGQTAVVAHVQTTRAADGTAYERFTSRGPFAVLPLVGGHYGVVWTLSPSEAERVVALTEQDFLEALQQQFGWRIGRLLSVGKRQAYPLKLSRAPQIVGSRSVLIGNAAQALHPVAGQGFNLGLRDAATLAQVLASQTERHHSLGQGFGNDESALARMLATYAEARERDRVGITRFTDGLVKIFSRDDWLVPPLRDLALLMFDLSPQAKQAMSRLSWGFAKEMPRLARGDRLVSSGSGRL